MTNLKLHENWQFTFNSNEIIFHSPLIGKSITIKVDEATKNIKFLNDLKNGIDLNDSDDTYKQNNELIFILQNEGLLNEVKSDLKIPQWLDRQIKFFDQFSIENNTGFSFNEKLINTPVVLVGVGGYNTTILQLLASIGIKKIKIVDFDTIEMSNLNRQVIYSKNDIGKKKTQVCKEYIENRFINTSIVVFDIKITNEDELSKIIESDDFVFNTFGYNFDMKNTDIISRYCVRKNIYMILSGGVFAGPIIDKNSNSCFNCFIDKFPTNFINQIETNASINRNRTVLPSFLPRLTLMSAIVVWEFVRFVTKIKESNLIDNIIQFDSYSYNIETYNLNKIIKCNHEN